MENLFQTSNFSECTKMFDSFFICEIISRYYFNMCHNINIHAKMERIYEANGIETDFEYTMQKALKGFCEKVQSWSHAGNK